MKCCMLCHEARPVYSADEIYYESFSKNEEITLQLAAYCGYELERFNRTESPDEYYCSVLGDLVKYKVLGLNRFSNARHIISIVV